MRLGAEPVTGWYRVGVAIRKPRGSYHIAARRHDEQPVNHRRWWQDGRSSLVHSVDFLWRAVRVVLEIDSDEHHSLPPDADRTDDRHVVLETLGFSVVHRRPAYIARDPARFVTETAAWLASRC